MDADFPILNIHYDTEEHYLAAYNSMIAIETVATIIQNLNIAVFDNKFNYQLVELPSESGTFLKKFAIPGIVILSVLESDVGRGVVKGLTGNSIEHYTEQKTIILKDMVIGFLSKDVETLEAIIPQTMNLDKSFKCKTDFYSSCQSNKKIKGLGFDDTKNFPIRSTDFIKHISQDKIRALEPEHSIVEVILISPITEDRKFKWKFQNKKNKQIISATMQDNTFKRAVLNGTYPIKSSQDSDTLTILIEERKREKNGVVENQGVFINKVYRFNDIEIDTIPKNLLNLNRLPLEDMWMDNE